MRLMASPTPKMLVVSTGSTTRQDENSFISSLNFFGGGGRRRIPGLKATPCEEGSCEDVLMQLCGAGMQVGPIELQLP